MVKKVGQRKFLLKCGYTDEQLDKMSPSMAHTIIGYIEKANRAKREKEKKRKEFTPPTLDEVSKYVLEKNLKVNAERFFNI